MQSSLDMQPHFGAFPDISQVFSERKKTCYLLGARNLLQ